MNLDWCFIVVWPQRQTFVRILLQNQNRPSAQSRRPTQRLDIPVHLFGTEFWAASLNGRLWPGRQRGSGRAFSKRVEWRTNEYPCADTATLFRRRRASRRPRRCWRFAHFGRKSGGTRSTLGLTPPDRPPVRTRYGIGQLQLQQARVGEVRVRRAGNQTGRKHAYTTRYGISPWRPGFTSSATQGSAQ